MLGEAVARVSSRSPQPSSWEDAATALLDSMEDRDLAIADARILRLKGEALTLQELGDQFGITRERVRQIEVRLRRLLATATQDRAIWDAVKRVRGLGSVFVTTELAQAIDHKVSHRRITREVQLLLFLAGPYDQQGSMFVKQGFERVLGSAFEHLDPGGEALPRVRKALAKLGVRESQQIPVLNGLPNVRVIGERLIPWSGSLADKAVVVLAMAHHLLTAEEIHEEIGEGSLATLKNYLGNDARFRKRGPRRWGLAEWGGEAYESIAKEMADELGGLPQGMPVERLKRRLEEKFGIGRSSVEIMSATHPMFLRDGPWVRLRGPDQPYVPDTSLEQARDCVCVDGEWALRHPVTNDTLRGSGTLIPEPFAAYIGVLPDGRRAFQTQAGRITFSWPGQDPAVSSLRIIANRLSAERGDYLFLIPDGDRINVRVMHRLKFTSCDVPSQLLLLLGQEPAQDWRSACARALGLSPHATSEEVDDLLEARGDREVLRLFRSALLEQER